MEKEMRSNYNTNIQKFITSIIGLSQKLKETIPTERKRVMRQNLKKINFWMAKNKEYYKHKDNPFSDCYEGILFPFQGNKPESNQVNLFLI